jgi:hypothetical protein
MPSLAVTETVVPPTFTPEPTATPVPASPTTRPTAMFLPASPTAKPTTAEPPSAAPTQVATPRVTAEAQALAVAPAASKPVVARPRGKPLAYELQFPSVSPVGDPPGYDGHTNPLSGVRVENPGLIQRRPLLVRYGNDRAARPHAGISQAELVMEDVMDAWWITRLTAVFLQGEPTKVGPLRSARPVNVEVLSMAS